jgi:hypothetical protein
MLVPIHVMKDEEDENGVKDTFHKNPKHNKTNQQHTTKQFKPNKKTNQHHQHKP